MILRRRIMVSQGGGGGVEGAVDLGLPSTILWASVNLGAENQEDAGMYFSYGNITGHYESEGYSFSENNWYLTPGYACRNNSISITDADHNAPLAILGEGWSLPTRPNFQELIDHTDQEAATINGVNGVKFMRKSNHSVFIFIPFVSGFNGTSKLNNSYYHTATYLKGTYWALKANNSPVQVTGANNFSYYGLPIRGKYKGILNGIYVYDIRGKLWTSSEWSAALNAGTVTNNDAVGVACISASAAFILAPTESETTLAIYSTSKTISGMDVQSASAYAKNDYRGIVNTEGMFSNFGANSPALNFVLGYRFKNGSTAYLPGCGELYRIGQDVDKVRTCLSICGMDDLRDSNYWSSSLYDTSGNFWAEGPRTETNINVSMTDSLWVRPICYLRDPEHSNEGAFVYTTDGKFYTAYEWTAEIANGSLDNDDAVGVAMISGEHRFVIDKTDANSGNVITFGGYQKDLSNIGVVCSSDSSVASLDFDGAGNTTKIISALAGYTDSYDTTGAPAAEACRAAFNGTGYLGALGEWALVYDNKDAINSLLTLVGGTALSTARYKTSTLYDASAASWRLRISNKAMEQRNRYNGDLVRAFKAI